MKKIVIIGLVVVIVLFSAIFVYLNYVYIPKQLKPMVIKLLEENLEKRVSIGKASYFPIKGVLFSKIQIINPDKTLFLEVDTIDLGLKSIPSIKKNAFSAKLKLLIKGLVFKQQELEVRGGCSVDIDVNIKSKDDVAFAAVVNLNDISVSGIKETGDITKGQGKIICSQSSFESENISATIGGQILSVLIKGDYDAQEVIIKDLDIDYIDTGISLKGRISEFANPKVDLTIDGLVKLKDISNLISGILLPALTGDCKITAECTGIASAIETLVVNAKVLLSNASVEKIKIANLKADIKLENGVLNLAPLDCDFYSGKITGAAKATIIDKNIPVQGSIDAKNIDIAPLVKDVISQDIGQGIFNAHVGISGSVADLNLLNGTGWFKVLEGKLKMPPNFAKVAKTLRVAGLADMNIEEVSATFSLSDGKLETQDLIMIAPEATISGKGYVDLEQYVDFEAIFKLSPEFIQSAGGVGQLLSFASDETGTSLAKVRVYDKLSQLKYKVAPLPVQDILKDKIKGELKNIFKQAGKEEPKKSEIQDQLKKGLEKLFR